MHANRMHIAGGCLSGNERHTSDANTATDDTGEAVLNAAKGEGHRGWGIKEENSRRCVGMGPLRKSTTPRTFVYFESRPVSSLL
jgi:hypothetical protein